MKPKIHARRQFLVNKQIQLSYAWLLILCVGIAIVMYGVTSWYTIKVCHNIAGEEALVRSLTSFAQRQFLIGSLLALAIVSVALLILGVFASHRITGPMHRIAKNLNLVGVENRLDPIRIRKRDQLKEMADAFNHMVHALKDRMYQDMRLIDQVKGRVSLLHDSLKGESLDMKKLSDQVKEIDKLATELRDKRWI